MVDKVPDPTPENIAQLLALRVAEHGTARQYLADLLCALWIGEADAKYGMTGNSDWQYDLYEPMREAELIPEWRDGWGIGYRLDGSAILTDEQRADALICAAIRHMVSEPA